MKNILAAVAFAAALVAASAAQAGVISYATSLSGAAEATPNASTGSGWATVDWDNVAHTMRVIVSFTGLTGAVFASHIHCCTAVANAGEVPPATQTPTFLGFPLGVMAGTYDHIFDMTLASSYRTEFLTANGGSPALAEVALFAGLDAGKAYLNIHTTAFRPGEIRGFLQVPEPSSALLAGLSLAALGFTLRKRSA